MEDRSSPSGLAATRDHVTPKSRGGRFIVLACRLCNELKRDMLPDDWRAFMQDFPRWWAHPEFKDIGKQRWRGDPASAVVPTKATVAETKRTYAQWQEEERKQRVEDARALVIPYRESIMIMRHGKDYWRAWKERGEPPCECCKHLPKMYDDPKAQAAFEAVYSRRQHMLRTQA